MSRGTVIALILTLGTFGAAAQSPAVFSFNNSFNNSFHNGRCSGLICIESVFPVSASNPSVLFPRTGGHGPKAKFHIHISRLHPLRVKVQQSIYTHRGPYTRTKAFPLWRWAGGRLAFGVEAHRILLLREDHRYSILSRQSRQRFRAPEQSWSRSYAFSLRWNLDRPRR